MGGGSVHAITSAEEFNKIINSGKVVIVDFYATWCGPCKFIAPKVEAFSKQYTSADFIQVDVDEVPDVAEGAGIRAMPTFQAYKDGKMIKEVVGADPVKLEAMVRSVVGA